MLVVLAAPAGAAPAQTNLANRAAVFTVAKEGVGDVSIAQAAADKAQAQLGQALSEAQVPVADVPALFPTPAPPATATKLVKEGLEAFDNLDTDVAGKKFQEALTFLEQNPGAADTKTLTQLHLFLGTIALQGGKAGKKKAAEELTRAAVLDPSYDLDPKFFGPDVKKEFEKAVADLDKKPKAELTFNSVPGGAEVSFGTMKLGQTPITKPVAVVPGRHLVTFMHPGYEIAGVLVDVTTGESEAKAELKPVAAYAAQKSKMNDVLPGNFGGKQVPNAAVSVADAMKSRFLVVAEVDNSGSGKLEVWDAAKGNRLKDVSLTAGKYASAAEQVKKFIANPSPLDNSVSSAGSGNDTVATVEADGASEPITKKWWFWTAIGVVVVGGAAAGIAVAASSNANTYNPALGTF